MNKKSKAASKSKNNSIYISIEQFIQRQTKKTFVVGAFIGMSAAAMPTIASTDHPGQTARNLVSSISTQQTSNLPRDVQSLRQQLIEKTRELQEYKASIFRASHPQDHAKITELNQRIAELKKNEQELIKKINAQEIELSRAKKQMNGLEVASDALTDYIQKQRAIVEAEKNELLARIQAHEEDTRLENESNLNEKLMIDLVVLMDTIATYENHITKLEEDHNKDLQDALQDASMLKFELADKRTKAHEKEHELMVSSLNYMAIAHDLKKSHKVAQNTTKSKLFLTKMEMASLNSTIEDLKKENARIQNEYDKHVDLISGGKQLMEKHFATRHVLANQLLEKDDALNVAVIYYEQVINEKTDQLQSLKDSLSQAEDDIQNLVREKELLISQHTTEKQMLNEELADRNQMASEEATREFVRQIELLNQKLVEEEGSRKTLQASHDELFASNLNTADYFETTLKDHYEAISGHENTRQSLRLAMQEKESTLKSALSASEETANEYLEQIESLKERLVFEQETVKELKKVHDELSANHVVSSNHFEHALQEKEDHFKKASEALQSSIDTHLKHIEELEEHLAISEKEHNQLKNAHEDLRSQLSQTESEKHALANALQETEDSAHNKYTKLESQKLKLEQELVSLQETEDHFKKTSEELQSSIDTHLKHVEELEEHLEKTSEALQSSIDTHLKHIGELEEHLTISEKEHNQLKNAHENLRSQLSQTESEKHALANALQETEDSAHSKYTKLESQKLKLEQELASLQEKEDHFKKISEALQSSIDTHLKHVGELEEHLTISEKEHNQLKNAHENLRSQLSQTESEKHALANALQETEDSAHSKYTKLESQKLKLEQELHNHQLDSHHKISLLTDQISDNHGMINSLKDELAKLYENFNEKFAKEMELEQAIHSLTVVAEQQDHALAQASSAFSMVQEYNHHLEADNAYLKNRLNHMEIAERSGNNNSNGNSKDSKDQNPIPPALFNLLKPNSSK